MNLQVVPCDDHDKLPAILRALAGTQGARIVPEPVGIPESADRLRPVALAPS